MEISPGAAGAFLILHEPIAMSAKRVKAMDKG
jgi:hypothetical protein